MRRAGAAVLLAVVLAAGGCGVPSDSGVVVEGRAAEPAPAFGDESTSEPPGRTATIEPRAFVTNFLAAAAGDPDPKTSRALPRVRDFLTPEFSARWDPDPRVQVIRLQGELIVDGTQSGFRVQMAVTVLGELIEGGKFQPGAARTQEYTFELVKKTVERRTELYVSDIQGPEAVLLSDDALGLYFDLRPIYFWSADHRVLVPDLRYLPRRDVPAAQRPMEIINWLLAGPSGWLEPAVESLPQGARLIGNVPDPAGGALKVELSRAADTQDAEQVRRLATQLRWSLRWGSGGDLPLELVLDGDRETFSDADYLAANPAHREGAEPARYGIVGGKVRQLSPASGPAPEVPAQYNGAVERAAIARQDDRTLMALLRRRAGGKIVLEVGHGGAAVTELRATDLRASAVGQPVWLPGGEPLGLVVADGRLVSFRASGGDVVRVANAPAGITAFAVPPDGCRLAYVAHGRLYVAALRRERSTIVVGAPLEVPTTFTSVAAVGWSQQDWLVVAGTGPDGLVGIQDITVDGAGEASPRLGQFGTEPVVHLVTATDDPVNGRGEGQVMYVANQLAYELFSQQRPLTDQDVAGARPTPSGDQPGGRADPTYPFFLG